jgi:hypothetical protein
LGIPAPDTAPETTVENPEPEGIKPAVFLGLDRLALIDPEIGLKASLDGGATWEETGPISDNTADVVATALNDLEVCDAEVLGAGVLVTGAEGGAGVTLVVRWGESSSDQISASGAEGDPGLPETRSYSWTWINTEAGLTMESGPSPPSDSVDVYDGGTVTVTGFSSPPSDSGVVVSGRRIYRSVAGVFLFVAEIDAFESEFVDDVKADALGEAMPGATWVHPPDDMRGLINLPNGMMAGFVGRDVLFCEPYRPYAWPSDYTQVVDYPVVGFGRMDTTLAVLTKGNPYFMQGGSPEVITVVKSDIEQACVSKRSIVSMNGIVLYASPDGLVLLSSSGSRLLTEPLFRREQWQSYFNPSSIHAYGHDGKYIAFYTRGTEQKGFVLDFSTNELSLNALYAYGGYSDLRNDTLFLVTQDKRIVKWGQGTPMFMTYKTKRFSMPQATFMACAQVEAEDYPLTFKLFLDGATTPIHTQTVTSRQPFRLPPKYARDWEVELISQFEIFNVVLAQTMTEIASA